MDRVDPVVLEKYIVKSGLPHRAGPQSFIFDCPKCGKASKLYIRRRDGLFRCFYCPDFRGRPEYALRELACVGLHEVRSALYGGGFNAKAWIELDLRNPWRDDDQDESLGQDDVEMEPVVLPFHYQPLDLPASRAGLAYVNQRGLNLDLCMRYGLRFSWIDRRVSFPVTKDDVLYGWQARAIADGVQPKIKTSSGLARDQLLLFWDQSRTKEHLIVVEGPVDALKCDLAGGAVAAMGKNLGRKQVQMIAAHPGKAVYVGLDPDAASEAARLVRDLGAKKDIYLLTPASGFKDLGEMSMEAVREQFCGAPRISAGHLFMYFKRPTTVL